MDHLGQAEKADVSHFDNVSADPKVLEAEYVPNTPEERRLVRKMDLHLLPALWTMYVFNYLDRTNIGVGILSLLNAGNG